METIYLSVTLYTLPKRVHTHTRVHPGTLLNVKTSQVALMKTHLFGEKMS